MKNFKLSILGCILSVGLVYSPVQSHGFLIGVAIADRDWDFDYRRNDREFQVISLAIGCLILAPICLLEENDKSIMKNYNYEDLIANDYSEEQAKLVLRDSGLLNKYLYTEGLQLQIEKNDTPESIRRAVNLIFAKFGSSPSEAYLKFMSEDAMTLAR